MLQLRLVGYTEYGQPVYSISGGAPEDGEGEGGGSETDGEDNSGESDGSGTQEDDYTPPSKAEYIRMQAALKKANGESAQRRKWLEEHGVNPRDGKRYDADEDDEDEEDASVRPKAKASSTKKKADADDDAENGSGISQADLDRLDKLRRTEGKKAAQREATLVSALRKKAVAAGLQEAGWNGKGANIIERMIDLGDLEIDDDGDVIGLSEQIADVKTEMPEWFRKPRPAKAAAASSNGGAREVDGADKTGTKKVATKADPNGWLKAISARIDGEDV